MGGKVCKIMKKIFRLFMAVCVLVLSMSSRILAGTWGPGSTALSSSDQYIDAERTFLQSAVTRTTSLDCMAARSMMILDMQGQDIPVTVSSDLKFKNRNSGDLKYQVELHTVKEESLEDVSLFYSGGYYCMDADGQKLKISMDLDEAREDLNFDPNSIGLAGLDSIQNLQISDDGNGNKLCTFLCDVRELEMDNYLYFIYQQMDIEWADVETKEVKGSFLVNQEGYCTIQTVDIVMDVTMEEKTVGAEIKVDIEYVNPGRPVDFVLPSTETYTDVS